MGSQDDNVMLPTVGLCSSTLPLAQHTATGNYKKTAARNCTRDACQHGAHQVHSEAQAHGVHPVGQVGLALQSTQHDNTP